MAEYVLTDIDYKTMTCKQTQKLSVTKINKQEPIIPMQKNKWYQRKQNYNNL